MAELDFYYPFDSVDGDRRVVAATERRFFGKLFNDGVVGSDSFKATATAAGVYSIAEGVCIVGGAVGGLINARSVTAQPASGQTYYIVLRLNTELDVRNLSLEVVDAAQSATADDLDAGGVRDLVLYEVKGDGSTYTLTDKRPLCSSFDASVWAAKNESEIAAMTARGDASMDALAAQFQGAIDAANAENAGLWGSMGRQGFINPTFNINQRDAESYSVNTGATYTFDRWLLRSSATSAAVGGIKPLYTVEVQRAIDGDRNALVLDIAPFGSDGAVCVSQAIERGLREFCHGGKSFTVSFDAKASEETQVAVEPVQFGRSGDAGTAIKAQTVTVGTEWQRYSMTFQGTMDAATAGSTGLLKIAFFAAWRGQGTRFGVANSHIGGNSKKSFKGTVYFANMQINAGTAALPCYVPPHATELEQCRRYFFDCGPVSLASTRQLASTKQHVCHPLPVPTMFARTPDVTVKDRAGTEGKASAQTVGGVWRNGLEYALSSTAPSYVTFMVTNTDTTGLVRIWFSHVALNADYYD